MMMMTQVMMLTKMMVMMTQMTVLEKAACEAPLGDNGSEVLGCRALVCL